VIQITQLHILVSHEPESYGCLLIAEQDGWPIERALGAQFWMVLYKGRKAVS
jgi:hypothetical protein